MILIDRIVTLRSRSPCGERGLKSAQGYKAALCYGVAPRAGSVD